MAMMQMLSNETGSEKTNPLKTQAIFHICDYKMAYEGELRSNVMMHFCYISNSDHF